MENVSIWWRHHESEQTKRDRSPADLSHKWPVISYDVFFVPLKRFSEIYVDASRVSLENGWYNQNKQNSTKPFPIARFMGPTWGLSGADRTQMGPVLTPWTLLSGHVHNFQATNQIGPFRYFPLNRQSTNYFLDATLIFDWLYIKVPSVDFWISDIPVLAKVPFRSLPSHWYVTESPQRSCKEPHQIWPWYSIDDHYDDVIMGAMASQITSLTIVYSTVYSGADQRKHQSSASLAFAGKSPGTGEFPAQMASNAENVSI